MSERTYTITEIDKMRAAVSQLVLWGPAAESLHFYLKKEPLPQKVNGGQVTGNQKKKRQSKSGLGHTCSQVLTLTNCIVAPLRDEE